MSFPRRQEGGFTFAVQHKYGVKTSAGVWQARHLRGVWLESATKAVRWSSVNSRARASARQCRFSAEGDRLSGDAIAPRARKRIVRDRPDNATCFAIDRASDSTDAAAGSVHPLQRGWPFVSGLETVAAQIDALMAHGDPTWGVTFYELFIAGCHEKAEELDDSSGEFGMFVEGLFGGWIRAREAAGADPDETAAAVLHWIENDRMTSALTSNTRR
jgi:hypothetical protein